MHDMDSALETCFQLTCCRIVKEIARSVDLNTLHALAGTCRQFHTNITPFRHQLVKETLRCENEYIETLSQMLHGSTAIPNSVKSVLELLREVGDIGKLMRGNVGMCARDMVGECRRCSRIVCRVIIPLSSRVCTWLRPVELHDQSALHARLEEQDPPSLCYLSHCAPRPASLHSKHSQSRIDFTVIRTPLNPASPPNTLFLR